MPEIEHGQTRRDVISNRRTILALVVPVVIAFVGSVGVDQLLLRAFGVHSPWISGALIGGFAVIGIVVTNWIIGRRGR